MSAANSDLGLLFFVVAVIWLCFLIVMLLRTSIALFSVKRYPNTYSMKIFRAFYGSLWIQAILNGALYWVLFANQANQKGPRQGSDGYKSVVLIFVPSILMSFNYAVLYLQLEDMQKRSRSQGGITYLKQEQHKKIEKIMNIVSFAYVGIYMIA